MDKPHIRIILRKDNNVMGRLERYLSGREGDEDYYLSNGEEVTYVMINGISYPVMWRETL